MIATAGGEHRGIGDSAIQMFLHLRDDRSHGGSIVDKTHGARWESPGQESFVASAVIRELMSDAPHQGELIGNLGVTRQLFADLDARNIGADRF